VRERLKAALANYLPARLAAQSVPPRQSRAEYVEWLSADLADLVCRFYLDQGLAADPFVSGMGAAFATRRFEPFVKKWLTEYLFKLFGALEGRAGRPAAPLFLEDNPLHRAAVAAYARRFGAGPEVVWEPAPGPARRLANVLAYVGAVAWLALRNGVRFSSAPGGRKVLREAIWGLTGRGAYFHDDFLVDGKAVRPEDFVLFSREEALGCVDRSKAREHARASRYAHFDLPALRLGLRPLVRRVLPLYAGRAAALLLGSAGSEHFTLFSSLLSSFAANALPYERVFSNFSVASELGHNYFSSSHVAEAVVCENHGAGYYLLHWSDNSVAVDGFLAAFLGCDAYLPWGRAHLSGVETGPARTDPIGYFFKDRIRGIRRDAGERARVLAAMGVPPGGKVVGAFDETFGGEIKMTEEHFLVFWKTMLDLAAAEPGVRVLFKPKGTYFHDRFTDEGRRRFDALRAEAARRPNVTVLDGALWSFIEPIAVSDLVVTQGMTSSSTIALVCGVDALYLDQARYGHPFAAAFKDRIVFDDPGRLLERARALLRGGSPRPLELIPEPQLRDYDAFDDDRGIERLRARLTVPRRAGGPRRGRVGVVIQARMGSTRLPGKVLLPLAGRPMLEFLLDRLKRCREADELVVATTLGGQDDPVAALAARAGASCFRGDEDDVLGRFHGAALALGLDVVVRVTADCPLTDPALLDEMVAEFKRRGELDYLSNTLVRRFPRGLDLEVFSRAALDWAHRFAARPYQREHVTPHLTMYGDTAHWPRAADASAFRVTVDTEADLEAVRALVAAAPGRPLGHEELVALLRSRPDIAAINRESRQKVLA
jgi:spore coat polysaccharide biosynthesis protein SpsF